MKMRAKAVSEQTATPLEELAEDVERKLIREWGFLLSGKALAKSLGYRSVGTMRQAIKHHAVPVPLFSIKNRRGKYASARDVARWVAEQLTAVGLPETHSQVEKGGDSV